MRQWLANLKGIKQWLANFKGIKQRLVNWKDATATVQSLATIAALLIGGFWTYKTFVRFRQDRPRLSISHAVEHFPLSNHRTLLVVKEKLSNIGPVALQPTMGGIRVIQLLPVSTSFEDKLTGGGDDPLNDTEDDSDVWKVIGSHEHPWIAKPELIEPGEDDTITNFFVIPDYVEAVDIFSYVANPTENNKMSWQVGTICDLRTKCVAADQVNPLPNK
jgi:hypothetical protein